jgi:hypothetical protein
MGLLRVEASAGRASQFSTHLLCESDLGEKCSILLKSREQRLRCVMSCSACSCVSLPITKNVPVTTHADAVLWIFDPAAADALPSLNTIGHDSSCLVTGQTIGTIGSTRIDSGQRAC